MRKDKNIKSIRSTVYDYIRTEMDKGAVVPGASLNMTDLAEVLGTSKTPLREAMIRLEAEGFVTIVPRKGVIVNRLDLDDVKYLFAVIGALESTLIVNSLENYDQAALDRMGKLNENMRASFETGDFASYDAAHYAYHNIFLEIAGKNVFAERVLTPIKTRLWDFPRKGIAMQWINMACEEHEQIVEAIEQRDKEQVLFLILERHWSYEYNEHYVRRVYFPYD